MDVSDPNEGELELLPDGEGLDEGAVDKHSLVPRRGEAFGGSVAQPGEVPGRTVGPAGAAALQLNSLIAQTIERVERATQRRAQHVRMQPMRPLEANDEADAQLQAHTESDGAADEDGDEELNLKDLRVQNNPEIDAWQRKVLEQILAMPLESNMKLSSRASQPIAAQAPLAEVSVIPPASQKPDMLTIDPDTSGLGVDHHPLEPSSDNAPASSSDKVHHKSVNSSIGTSMKPQPEYSFGPNQQKPQRGLQARATRGSKAQNMNNLEKKSEMISSAKGRSQYMSASSKVKAGKSRPSTTRGVPANKSPMMAMTQHKRNHLMAANSLLAKCTQNEALIRAMFQQKRDSAKSRYVSLLEKAESRSQLHAASPNHRQVGPSVLGSAKLSAQNYDLQLVRRPADKKKPKAPDRDFITRNIKSVQKYEGKKEADRDSTLTLTKTLSAKRCPSTAGAGRKPADAAKPAALRRTLMSPHPSSSKMQLNRGDQKAAKELGVQRQSRSSPLRFAQPPMKSREIGQVGKQECNQSSDGGVRAAKSASRNTGPSAQVKVARSQQSIQMQLKSPTSALRSQRAQPAQQNLAQAQDAGGKRAPATRQTPSTNNAMKQVFLSPASQRNAQALSGDGQGLRARAGSSTKQQAARSNANTCKTEQPVRRKSIEKSALSKERTSVGRMGSPVPAGGGLIPKSQEYLKKVFEQEFWPIAQEILHRKVSQQQIMGSDPHIGSASNEKKQRQALIFSADFNGKGEDETETTLSKAIALKNPNLLLQMEAVEELLHRMGFLRKSDHFQDKLEFIKLWSVLIQKQKKADAEGKERMRAGLESYLNQTEGEASDIEGPKQENESEAPEKQESLLCKQITVGVLLTALLNVSGILKTEARMATSFRLLRQNRDEYYQREVKTSVQNILKSHEIEQARQRVEQAKHLAASENKSKERYIPQRGYFGVPRTNAPVVMADSEKSSQAKQQQLFCSSLRSYQLKSPARRQKPSPSKRSVDGGMKAQLSRSREQEASNHGSQVNTFSLRTINLYGTDHALERPSVHAAATIDFNDAIARFEQRKAEVLNTNRSLRGGSPAGIRSPDTRSPDTRSPEATSGKTSLAGGQSRHGADGVTPERPPSPRVASPQVLTPSQRGRTIEEPPQESAANEEQDPTRNGYASLNMRRKQYYFDQFQKEVRSSRPSLRPACRSMNEGQLQRISFLTSESQHSQDNFRFSVSPADAAGAKRFEFPSPGLGKTDDLQLRMHQKSTELLTPGSRGAIGRINQKHGTNQSPNPSRFNRDISEELGSQSPSGDSPGKLGQAKASLAQIEEEDIDLKIQEVERQYDEIVNREQQLKSPAARSQPEKLAPRFPPFFEKKSALAFLPANDEIKEAFREDSMESSDGLISNILSTPNLRENQFEESQEDLLVSQGAQSDEEARRSRRSKREQKKQEMISELKDEAASFMQRQQERTIENESGDDMLSFSQRPPSQISQPVPVPTISAAPARAETPSSSKVESITLFRDLTAVQMQRQSSRPREGAPLRYEDLEEEKIEIIENKGVGAKPSNARKFTSKMPENNLPPAHERVVPKPAGLPMAKAKTASKNTKQRRTQKGQPKQMLQAGGTQSAGSESGGNTPDGQHLQLPADRLFTFNERTEAKQKTPQKSEPRSDSLQRDQARPMKVEQKLEGSEGSSQIFRIPKSENSIFKQTSQQELPSEHSRLQQFLVSKPQKIVKFEIYVDSTVGTQVIEICDKKLISETVESFCMKHDIHSRTKISKLKKYIKTQYKE